MSCFLGAFGRETSYEWNQTISRSAKATTQRTDDTSCLFPPVFPLFSWWTNANGSELAREQPTWIVFIIILTLYLHHLDEDDDTSTVHNKKEIAEYRRHQEKESKKDDSDNIQRNFEQYSCDGGGAIYSTIVCIRNNSSMYGVASSGGRDHYWRRPLVICSVLSVCA